MTKLKGIFAVSFIAMMSVGVASANIASQGYVDQEVGTRLSAISGSTSGAGNVVTSVTASGGTVTATKGITAEVTSNKTTSIAAAGSASDTKYPSEKAVATALSAKANTADIPTKVSQLSNDSGFITADELPDDYSLPAATVDSLGGVKSGGDITVGSDGAVTVNQAARATTATTATNATNDAGGNEITETYATKDELTSGLAGKQATLTSAQLNAVNSGITSAKVTTYDGYNAKITAAKTAADDAADAAAAAQTAANGKVTANAAITAGTATKITYDAKGLVTGGASLTASDIPTIPSTKVSGLGTLATKSAVTSAEITDGTITNADIANNAAIAASKISGLSTVAKTGSYDDLADKPTIPSAYVLKAATSSALGGVKSGGDITVSSTGAVTVNSATRADSATTATNATKATQDASGNVITTTYATKAQLNDLDSSTSGSGAVVTNVSQTNGKVTVTKGNVQIPVGSATATTYATIWVE